MFNVYTRDQPDSFPGGSTVSQIARVILKSELVTSKFGDERLFFQHEEQEEDDERRPEWTPYIPSRSPSDRWGQADAPGWP